MLLAIDIGNTNVGFGLFDESGLRRHGRVSADDAYALTEVIGDEPISRIALASVAPSMTDRIVPMLALQYNTTVLVAGRDVPFGIEIQCDEPEKVGADRLLDAIAAYARTQLATIVVDVGSAVTVDFVSARGTFVGGAIAPGPQMMLDALHHQTELLPNIELKKPDSPVGHSSTDALLSGAYWGAVGLVDRLVAEISVDQAAEAKILVTGGAGEAIASEMQGQPEYIPTLTLEGLALIAS